MHFFFVVLIISFVIFLYTLYYLANDDLVIIKKDMPLDKVFNAAFLTGIVALFTSRIFYVFFHPRPVLLTPLGFVLFPYFPGLSILGAVIGGFLFLGFYARKEKLPIGKLLDFSTIALLSSLPFGYLGLFLLSGKSYLWPFIFSFLIYTILFFLSVKYLLPLSFRGNIKNGSIGIIFLVVFPVITFLLRIIENFKGFKIISTENVVLLLLFLFSLAIFIREEVIGKRVKK